MKKKFVYLGITMAMTTSLVLTGCGSKNNEDGGSEANTTAQKKTVSFDDLLMGTTQSDLVATYGEPDKKITDVTEIMQIFTTDMTEFQTQLEDDAKAEKMIDFFGGTEEKAQAALAELNQIGDKTIEIYEYSSGSEEIRVYVMGEKVLFRSF